MKQSLILAAVLISFSIAKAQPWLATTALPLAVKMNANKTVYKDFTLYRYSADGIAYKLYYDNRGKWLHSILSYDGSSLPAPITDQIKTDYGNYAISWIDELRYPGQMAVYRVQLKKDNKTVIVQANGEEMEREAEYEQ